MKLGVVGYSSGKFDERKARDLFVVGLSKVEGATGKMITSVVSGLTDVGVPAIAYRIADDFGLHTVGIACDKAFQYDLYPVDKQIIVGDDWGDESRTFLSYIDALLRIGGGDQSMEEVATFKRENPTAIVVEFDLPREGSSDKAN